MINCKNDFHNRIEEINEHIKLMESLENQALLDNNSGFTLSHIQQRILYSSSILMIYNLLESTVENCILELERTISVQHMSPGKLNPGILNSWIQNKIPVQTNLNRENLIKSIISIAREIENGCEEFTLSRGGGGNWDDEGIYRYMKQLGCTLDIPDSTSEKIKRPIFNDMGIIKSIVKFRNRLAHGNISFRNCSEHFSISDIKYFSNTTVEYLYFVISSFETFINAEFPTTTEAT